jgi:hypothetical protein
MKIIFTILSLLFAAHASADIIVCSFTEPFLTTTYSMAQQKLTVNDDVTGKAKVFKNVSFQIMGPGTFELRNKKGEVLQTLNLTNKGSNGMGETVYPFEVVSSEKIQPLGANNGYGGCTSNFLKTIESEEEK